MTDDPTPRHEINWGRMAVCAGVGAALWFGPQPSGVSSDGWRVLAVFSAVILSFIVRPLPMGPMVLLGLLVLAMTGTLGATQKESFQYALTGFGDTTVWLVVAAFLIAGAVIRTGLGRRIALLLVSKLGRTTLGLGYATCGAELVLGPFIPSNTARGGGVMSPIVDSLSAALDSGPLARPRRAGEFLVLVGAHANLISAAMYLTGMAANPLISVAARDIFDVSFGWNRWLAGSIVPGLASMLLLPLFLYKLAPPELRDARPAQQKARDQLRAMGPISPGQRIMAGVFVMLIALWATKPLHGLDTGLVALLGVAVLLVTGVERWQDMCGNSAAWDTLVWLGGLLTMANALKDHGVVGWFAGEMQSHVGGLSAIAAALVMAVIYFYSMYGFSMLTGHITALAAAFMGVALAAGTPPLLMVALLAYFSNLCGCTTNYSSGPIVIYFGLGYVPVARWFKIGFLVSLFHLAVWLGIGLPYWKLLGWW